MIKISTIELCNVTSSLDTDADVHIGEASRSEELDRLEDLVLKALGLNKLQRASVEFDQTLAPLAVGDGHCSFLLLGTANTRRNFSARCKMRA